MTGSTANRPVAVSQAADGPRRRGPVVLGLAFALALAGCSDEVQVRDEDGVVVEAGTWSVFDLRDGDCLDPDPDVTGEVAELPLVPCDEPHAQEVFATVTHPEGAFPGAAAVSLWADGACLGDLEQRYDLTLDDGVFVSYLLPTFISWNRDDDRRVVCVLVFPDQDGAVGSVVAGTALLDPPAPPADVTGNTDDADPAEGDSAGTDGAGGA